MVIDIYEDVKEECEKFGRVEGMEIPRPSGGSRQSPGVGKIFVKFDTNESAKKAMEAMAGRKFADRTVVVTFFGEVSYSGILTADQRANNLLGIFRRACMVMKGQNAF